MAGNYIIAIIEPQLIIHETYYRLRSEFSQLNRNCS